MIYNDSVLLYAYFQDVDTVRVCMCECVTEQYDQFSSTENHNENEFEHKLIEIACCCGKSNETLSV